VTRGWWASLPRPALRRSTLGDFDTEGERAGGCELFCSASALTCPESARGRVPVGSAKLATRRPPPTSCVGFIPGRARCVTSPASPRCPPRAILYRRVIPAGPRPSQSDVRPRPRSRRSNDDSADVSTAEQRGVHGLHFAGRSRVCSSVVGARVGWWSLVASSSACPAGPDSVWTRFIPETALRRATLGPLLES